MRALSPMMGLGGGFEYFIRDSSVLVHRCLVGQFRIQF